MQRSNLLLASFVFGAFVMSAHAAPVTLTCTPDSGTQSIQVIFDEDAKTAVAGDDPVSTATFTDTTISWGELDVRVNDWEFHKLYSLNRDTGVLSMTGAMKADNQERWANMGQTFHCAVTKKLF